jgi:preprotein translocase subunit YajC
MNVFGTLTQVSTSLLKYSTPVSHCWWVVNFIFRGIVIFAVGSSIYGDEQGVFQCDTSQPGCKAMCFNRFSPMAHPRFWQFQFMFCLLPAFIFHLIVNNQTAQMKKVDESMKKIQSQIDATDDENAKKGYYSSDAYTKLEKKKKKLGLDRQKTVVTTDQSGMQEVLWTPTIRCWFIIQLGAKVVMELIFVYLYYTLQRQQSKKFGWAAWSVPDRYDCSYGEENDNMACSQNANIPCWVSRPMEKEVMMWYMLSMSLVSVALVGGEFFYVVSRVTVKANKRRTERKRAKLDLVKKPLLEPATEESIVKTGEV